MGGSMPNIDVFTSEPPQSQDEHSRAGLNLLRPSALRQQHMNEAYHSAKWKELDEKWAIFFYKANVPFNVVRHPSFIVAM
jgi:hypothetical protein